jgi:MoxR-like ATPase
VRRAIVGQDEAVELMLIALFCSGHILLEGPPGTAKTFLAQCFARTLGLDFGRIQFTPDLMPGDIVGSNLFNFQTSLFTLTRGPIFCDLLLADEINRTPPKTQAALLEAMQERSVTIDGETHSLAPRFMVIATQNPIEQQGVYPLPEAQLDRFLFKHRMGYPSAEEEKRIVTAHGARFGAPKPEAWGIERRVEPGTLAEAVAAVQAVPMVNEVTDYIVALVRATREAPDLEGGASPRAAAMLAGATRARAALDGRDYVIPDDVKALAPAVLRHRVLLSAAAEIEGRPVESVIARLIEAVDAPR